MTVHHQNLVYPDSTDCISYDCSFQERDKSLGCLTNLGINIRQLYAHMHVHMHLHI